MNNARENFIFQEEDDSLVEFDAAVGEEHRLEDDCVPDPRAQRQIQVLLDSITRIGGEVSRMRAEMDGLMEQNSSLLETFDRLKEVLEEKGQVNLEDFDLACEVMDANAVPLSQGPLRKLAN